MSIELIHKHRFFKTFVILFLVVLLIAIGILTAPLGRLSPRHAEELRIKNIERWFQLTEQYILNKGKRPSNLIEVYVESANPDVFLKIPKIEGGVLKLTPPTYNSEQLETIEIDYEIELEKERWRIREISERVKDGRAFMITDEGAVSRAD